MSHSKEMNEEALREQEHKLRIKQLLVRDQEVNYTQIIILHLKVFPNE